MIMNKVFYPQKFPKDPEKAIEPGKMRSEDDTFERDL